MNEIQTTYINRFNLVGNPLLLAYGFKTEVLQENESVKINIVTPTDKKYILSFSTHHLDYQEGVTIRETSDNKIDRDKIRIPNSLILKSGGIYQFSGENVDSEIIRLVQDFMYYIRMKNNFGSEPFEYCSQSATDLSLTCKKEYLIELDRKEIIRSTSEEHAYQNSVETIYRCKICDGFWKLSIDYYKRERWLKIGENTDQKYFESNNTDYNEKKWKSTLVFFHIAEAIKNGMELKCGQLNNIDNYYGLTCNPINLKTIKEISFDGNMGNYIRVDIFQCEKCKRYYKISEENDSHHGISRGCTKLNESDVDLYLS
jgi:hypothetical protein